MCSENRLRSPTGEEVFSAYPDVEAIGCGTNSDSETPLSGDLIEWADVILVMEKTHKRKVSTKFQDLLKNKRLICLDIPDNYQRMQPELVDIFKSKVSRVIRL